MPPAIPPTLYILGAGSIGLLHACACRISSYPVRLLLRHETFLRLGSANTLSVSLTSPAFGKTGARTRVFDIPIQDATEYKSGITNDSDNRSNSSSFIRFLLVTTKANDAADAISSILHRLPPIQPTVPQSPSSTSLQTLDPSHLPVAITDVVLMTNGVQAASEEVAAVLDSANVSTRLRLATTTHGVHRDDHIDCGRNERRVIHAGVGRTTFEKRCHSPEQGVRYDAVEFLRDTWNAAKGVTDGRPFIEPSIIEPSEMVLLQWKKLIVNCAINPLTALRGYRNGNLLLPFPGCGGGGNLVLDPKAVELASEAAYVASAVLAHSTPAAEQPAITAEDAVSLVSEIAQSTSSNISSMLQDVRDCRTTEIQYINGYVGRVGRCLGLKTPLNDWACGIVEGLGDKYQSGGFGREK